MRTKVLTALAMLAVATPAALMAQRETEQRESGRRVEEHVQLPRPGAASVIGVRLSDVTADNMKTLKLSRPEGAIVESVNPNSPAATAGLRNNDVIVQFDGERVRSASHLTRLVAETPAGREVPLSAIRDGRKVDLTIKPEAGRGWFDPRIGGMVRSEEWREQMEAAMRELGRNLPDVVDGVRGGIAGRGRLGVNVQQVDGDLAEYFGVKSGVLVASVQPDSAAAKAGLKAGDVITAVNGKAVTSPGELVAALPSSEASADVTLTVIRDKKEMSLKATIVPIERDRPARGRRV